MLESGRLKLSPEVARAVHEQAIANAKFAAYADRAEELKELVGGPPPWELELKPFADWLEAHWADERRRTGGITAMEASYRLGRIRRLL